ncbi:hypothetical protein QTJ16_004797 [Diplocarpon rosae]|uniref:Cyanovirin-N domain-containing protein n=1 Tax=Diplocarpon rosae TaxID=946125 RepID=A0AAD9WBI7_9HELO|nr:hypothetical protein QTJ16_004797 [Diplocarpon rosae]
MHLQLSHLLLSVAITLVATVGASSVPEDYESGNTTSPARELARRDNPNDGSNCYGFIVDKAYYQSADVTLTQKPNGNFAAYCTDANRSEHQTAIWLNQFITLDSNGRMYWKYLAEGNTFGGYCTSCDLASNWVLTCTCSTKGWANLALYGGGVQSSINIFRSSWSVPGVWYNKDTGGWNVAA